MGEEMNGAGQWYTKEQLTIARGIFPECGAFREDYAAAYPGAPVEPLCGAYALGLSSAEVEALESIDWSRV